MSAARQLVELKREQWHRTCRRSFLPFAFEALAARGETPARHRRGAKLREQVH
jgi:hypothetical protein